MQGGDSLYATAQWAMATWLVGFVYLAVSQNLRYLFGLGYHPTIVFLKGFLECSPGYRGFDPQPFRWFLCFTSGIYDDLWLYGF